MHLLACTSGLAPARAKITLASLTYSFLRFLSLHGRVPLARPIRRHDEGAATYSRLDGGIPACHNNAIDAHAPSTEPISRYLEVSS